LIRVSPIIGIATAVALASTAFARPTPAVHPPVPNVRPVVPIVRVVPVHPMIFHHVDPMMRIAPLPVAPRPTRNIPGAGPNTRATVARPVAPRPVAHPGPRPLARPVVRRLPIPTAPRPIVRPPAWTSS